MYSRLSRDIRFLHRYAVVATTVALVATLAAFYGPQRRTRFTEIDVERLNIVEPDGKLDMVISDQARQHPGIVNGKIIPRSGPHPPGTIFFNHLGDEMGGLVYGANGGIGHFGSLTFDKVRGDQTIGFRDLESADGSYTTALEMWQQPNTPADILQARYEAIRAMTDTAARRLAIQALRDSGQLTTERLFLGKTRDNTAMLVLFDLKGRPRLRLSVNPDGTPAIEVLDSTGRATAITSER